MDRREIDEIVGSEDVGDLLHAVAVGGKHKYHFAGLGSIDQGLQIRNASIDKDDRARGPKLAVQRPYHNATPRPNGRQMVRALRAAYASTPMPTLASRRWREPSPPPPGRTRKSCSQGERPPLPRDGTGLCDDVDRL